MNTTTYLRWSLLIPIVLWALCLPIFVLLNLLPGSENLTDPTAPMDFMGVVGMFVIIYVFGIVIWVFPYVLLAMILFFWSFIGRAQTMLKVFALSPFAMVPLTVAIPSVLFLGASPGGFLGDMGVFKEWMSINLFLAAIALIWGYICVGMGYGLYRLLRHHGLIKDEPPVEYIASVPETA